MKRKAVCMLAVLASFGLGIANGVQAQSDRHDDRRGGPPHGMDHRDNRGHDNGRHEGDRRDDRRGERGRGIGPNHSIYRGDRLPPEWRSRQYRVERWREHQLPPPPPGYFWVQIGPDYALTAGATGVVAQIVIR